LPLVPTVPFWSTPPMLSFAGLAAVYQRPWSRESGQ
jgi:hypothetical protein